MLSDVGEYSWGDHAYSCLYVAVDFVHEDWGGIDEPWADYLV